MSTSVQMKTQAKTPAAPAAAHIPQPSVAVPAHEAEVPDFATQIEGAARLGHSLGATRVDGAVMPIIQCQEVPEEEGEELQMQWEPAALQGQEFPAEEKEEEVQTKPADGVQRQGGGEGFQLDGKTAARVNRARGSGQPLDAPLQAKMGQRLGHDFSGVRVHADAEADALNQQLSATAFTTGTDIFFKRGAYAPGSGSGRELMAHELSHVVQQTIGRVSGGGSGVTVRPPGDGLEEEANRAARVLMCREATDSNGQRTSASKLADEPGASGGMARAAAGAGEGVCGVVQRDCWDEVADNEEAVLATFAEPPHHRAEPDDPNQVYWRLQVGNADDGSQYFSPDDDERIWALGEAGIVTPEDREGLAVLHNWVPEWHYLAVYTRVESQRKKKAYWGTVGTQEDANEWLPGGAEQVVFPTDRVAELWQAVEVVEEGAHEAAV